MNNMGIFWITWYLSWVTLEFITKERIIMIKEQTKTMIIFGLGLLMFIGFNCGGDDEEESSEEMQSRMNEKYSNVIAHNDSMAALWDNIKDESVDLDSLLNAPYVPDSSKILAIKYPDDYFETFEEAFARARRDLGPDKGFIWMGKFYSTNYKEEGYPPWTYQSKSSKE